MTMIEEWRPSTTPRYLVSSFGRVRSPYGRILKQFGNGRGYRVVSLGEKNKQYVHRLVAFAFLAPGLPEQIEVDHINKDKADNRASNLRWATPTENLSQRRIGRGEGHYGAKLTDDAVREIRAAPTRKQAIQIGLRHGVSAGAVTCARTGATWKHV